MIMTCYFIVIRIIFRLSQFYSNEILFIEIDYFFFQNLYLFFVLFYNVINLHIFVCTNIYFFI